jgi:hypothetical protein
VLRPWTSLTAPGPNAWSTWAQASPATPATGVLSGPVYNYMNASATQVQGTSRINAGTDYAILGIDAAGSGKLNGVKVRFVSTGYGQFDPAIDLLPLSDGAGSGVYLYDEAAGSVVKISTNGLEWSDWGINAYGQPYRETFTDDASVVEALGHPITLVEGNRENIKITTPFDMTIAEALLQK